MTVYNDEGEKRDICDMDELLAWAFQKISDQRKEIDALRTQDGSCETCRWMNEDETGPHCKNCVHNAKDNYQPMTNHDRLRMMDKRTLAEWLDRTGICIEDKCPLWDVEGCEGQCADRIEEWLSKPVENQGSERDAAL